MIKNFKLTITAIIGVVLVFLLVIQMYKKSYVLPTMSDRDKIFAYGDIDDVREYLKTPKATVTMGNYYSLIDRNQPEVLEMMFRDFKLNPDMNIKDKDDTPLVYAAGEFKPKIVSVLVKYGADVDYKEPYFGTTPLIAASFTSSTRENNASLEITKILLKAGADINAESNDGSTALSGALSGMYDDLERAQYLIENGVDSTLLDSKGTSYIFYCSSIKCYKYFLSLGVSINSISSDGASILQDVHYVKTTKKLTKQLLAWGADICHKDNAGDIVLNYIERQGTGPHDKKENPEFYNEKVQENRASEIYKYLEKIYKAKCLSPKNNEITSVDKRR